MKQTGYLFLLSLVIFFASCHTTRKTASARHAQADTLPALPVSEIDIPVRIYAPPVLAKIESIVPREFTSDAWPNYVQPTCDFRYKYRFDRSALSFACVNNKIAVQFTGNYQVAGSRCLCSLDKPVTPWISGSCGFGKEPMRRIVIAVGSQLYFLPQYKIRSTSQMTQVQALDKCQVSLFSSDVTQLIMDSVKSSVLSFCKALDETVAGLSFSGMERQAAGLCYGKTNMGKYGYVVLHPTAIRLGQLNYIKDTFSISAGVSCKPELSSDSINHQVDPPALPPLTQTENRNGVSLYLDANYDYAFLSKLLRDTLYNKVFEVKGRNIVIKNVELKGIGHHAVEVRVDFAGSNKGSIYLRGTPVLDTAKQALTVPDLTYSLENEDLALKLAKSVFRNKIKKTLEGKSYLDIAAMVKSNLAGINEQLNRKLTSNFFTAGRAKDIRLIGLLAADDHIQVQCYVNAEISLLSNGTL
ncbi:MAG TPA: DUF4403 family protein [Puia sp.]|nr:DUF4403 family protein [Puia sp.]